MFAYYVRKTILKIHKGVIRAYKSRKDILYKDQKKKKQKNTGVRNTTQRTKKKRSTRTRLKTGGELRYPKGYQFLLH